MKLEPGVAGGHDEVERGVSTGPPGSLRWISPSGSGGVRPRAMMSESTTSGASWCAVCRRADDAAVAQAAMAARRSLRSPVGDSLTSATSAGSAVQR